MVIVSGIVFPWFQRRRALARILCVFSAAKREQVLQRSFKHDRFIEQLNAQGYIISTDVKNIGRTIYNVAKIRCDQPAG